MAPSEGKEHPGLSGEETGSMKKRACEKVPVKKGTVVDISEEPAMKKLRKLYHGMTPDEQERTGDYLNGKEANHGKA
jgi:hypothetical protein